MKLDWSENSDKETRKEDLRSKHVRSNNESTVFDKIPSFQENVQLRTFSNEILSSKAIILNNHNVITKFVASAMDFTVQPELCYDKNNKVLISKMVKAYIERCRFELLPMHDEVLHDFK
ncbi:11123_t:CDS:2, partial [Funneliformis geosporum]